MSCRLADAASWLNEHLLLRARGAMKPGDSLAAVAPSPRHGFQTCLASAGVFIYDLWRLQELAGGKQRALCPTGATVLCCLLVLALPLLLFGRGDVSFCRRVCMEH